MPSGVITVILGSSLYAASNEGLIAVIGAANSVKECLYSSPCCAVLGVHISMDSSFNTERSGMPQASY